MSRFLFCDFGIPNLIKDKDLPIGGATIQAYQWIQALLENGHEVGVLVAADGGVEVKDGLTIIETFNLGGKNPFSWLYERPRALERAICSYQPDYLIQAGAGFILFPLAKLARKHGIQMIHRIANNADLDNRIYKKASFWAVQFYKHGLRSTPIISCQNSFQLESLSNRFVNKDLLKLHNPFDCSQIPKQNNDRNSRTYVAWLGVYQYQKNMPLLVSICQRLPHVQFKIAGKSSPRLEIAEVKESLSVLGALPNVTLVGYLRRSEIITFLSNAICLLNTSRYEGFSNTFLEAFASGTPVATLSHNDPDHIISEEKLGDVGNDENQLISIIESTITSQEFGALSERCRHYITEHHDRNKLAFQLVEQLKNINEKYPN